MWLLEQFTVFDDNRVDIKLLSAQVTVTVPTRSPCRRMIRNASRTEPRLEYLLVRRKKAEAAARDHLGR